MSVTVPWRTDSSMRNRITINNKYKRRVLPVKPKIAIATVVISLIMSLSILISTEISEISNNVYAQINQKKDDSPSLANKITIQLNSVKFAPLTDNNYTQLKILVDYQTNDQSFVNTPMTGTMKVSLPDGSPLKTSSIQKGYVMGQSGNIQFATSFTDKTIQRVNADVYLTDTLGSEKISNTLKTSASLAK
jgi:hypothetical protein